MKAELINLMETKQNELYKESGILCNRLSDNFMCLQHVLAVMEEAIDDGRGGRITAEEAARRYLMNLNVLIGQAVDNNISKLMINQIQRRNEYSKLASLTDSIE
jgi:hypothetical protein